MSRSLSLIGIVCVLALVAGWAVEPRGYPARVLCLVLMAATIGQCWNLVGGLANQISLGHAAFFGIGAYASTVVQVKWGLSPWLGLPLGMALSILAALMISFPTMRLRGPYFALATLAFGEACRILATALPGITGGPQGISVPFIGDSFTMMQYRGAGHYVPIFVALFAVVSPVFALMSHGRLGYLMRAVKENEDAAEVAGVDTLRIKLYGATVSAALMAACGTLFAQFTFFFDPDSVFSASGISIRAALIAIVGGVGTLGGPMLGALLVVPLEELLSALLSDRAAGIAPLLFGIVLILLVILRPRGLVSLLAGWKKRRGT